MPHALVTRARVRLGLWCGLAACAALDCSSDAAGAGGPRLRALSVEGSELTPAFSPDVLAYRADVTLLFHTAAVHAVGEPGSTVSLTGSPDVPGVGADLTASRALAVGANGITIAVASPGSGERRYTIAIERHDQLWRDVHLMTAGEPRQDGYFGDYLRASPRFMYVAASRRGQLYENIGGAWVFQRPVEELFDVELAWMYEAAITDDTLALVAQPSGGVETLFILSRSADGAWLPAGQRETGARGTIRVAGDEMVFVAPASIVFFHRAAGVWTFTQQLPVPSPDIGFAERPTYFDASGVAFTERALVVGAPLADTADGSGGVLCADGSAGCKHDAGMAFVYERDASGVWAHAGNLEASNRAADMKFGQSAAIAGDRIAIGAAREGAMASESGAVYLFTRDGQSDSAWRPAGAIRASNGRAFDYFGDTVVLTGDTLVVAAPGHDGAPGAGSADVSAPDAGGVFVFVRTGDVWIERGPFKLPSDVAPPYPFPTQMVLSGAALLVPSNIADHVTAAGESLSHAGRVYYLP